MSKDHHKERLLREASAAASLIETLGIDDDELCESIAEGETSLYEAIEKALEEIDDCQARIAGCKDREEVFATRRRSAEKRVETLRSLIERALLISEVKTAKLNVATLTVSNTPPKPIITEEADIPSEYWKRPPPVLDKAKINRAIKDGVSIKGVSLSNGGTSLTIRRT